MNKDCSDNPIFKDCDFVTYPANSNYDDAGRDLGFKNEGITYLACSFYEELVHRPMIPYFRKTNSYLRDRWELNVRPDDKIVDSIINRLVELGFVHKELTWEV